jgi:hypothetical protein
LSTPALKKNWLSTSAMRSLTRRPAHGARLKLMVCGATATGSPGTVRNTFATMSDGRSE